MWDHWTTSSVSFSCLWGETKTFSHPPPCASRRPGWGEDPERWAGADRSSERSGRSEGSAPTTGATAPQWSYRAARHIWSYSPSNRFIPPWFRFIHSGRCLQRAGGAAEPRRPDPERGAELPRLPGIVLGDFNKGNFTHQLPNTDSLFNVRPERRTFWITATPPALIALFPRCSGAV